MLRGSEGRVDDERRHGRTTPAERRGILAASAIALVGLGAIAWTIGGAGSADGPFAWVSVVVGYLIGAWCLAFAGWFTVTYLRQRRSARRFSDPFGDGDSEAISRAASEAGLADLRTVLFVSPRGIGRSRMAAEYLRALTLGTHDIEAAGVAPEPASALDHVLLVAVTAVDRAVFDTRRPPQRVSAALVERAHLVVRIGCPRAFRVPSGVAVRDWDVPDPLGGDLEQASQVRGQLRRHVEELAGELGLAHRSLDLRDRVIPGQRHVFAAARAAELRPPVESDDESAWMSTHAEARLLVEVADAPERAAEINGRGPRRPDFVVPWLISAGAASSAFARELEWRALGSPSPLSAAEDAVARVVDGLVTIGALRPFSDARRLELRRSGRAQRDVDDPPERWPAGLAGEYPAMAEARSTAEDLATFEVVPDRMLAAYPDLDVEGDAWAAAAAAAAARAVRRG